MIVDLIDTHLVVEEELNKFLFLFLLGMLALVLVFLSISCALEYRFHCSGPNATYNGETWISTDYFPDFFTGNFNQHVTVQAQMKAIFTQEILTSSLNSVFFLT